MLATDTEDVVAKKLVAIATLVADVYTETDVPPVAHKPRAVVFVATAIQTVLLLDAWAFVELFNCPEHAAL